jgi:hypothetical protein
MVCAKHKISYDSRCPECSKADQAKEQGLTDSIAFFNQHRPKKTPEYKRPTAWAENPLYDGGRRGASVFRNKVYSAITILDRKYKNLLDKRKLADLDSALRNNLDDIFAVAHNDTEWTNVCRALGGKHNEKVYGPDGNLLGVQVSFGVTGYFAVDVDSNDQSAKTDMVTGVMLYFTDSKRIYLHSKDVDVSTVVHEMLHFFCHKKFYDAFAQPGVGPEWRTLNEGITEYLTRQAYTGGVRGAYEEEHKKVLDLLRGGLTDAEIQDAYFEGQIAALVEKMKAGEMKEDIVAAATGMDKVLSLAGRRGGARRGAAANSSNTGDEKTDF